MGFDENTRTMNVGSRDWLEASKGMQVRGHLPPGGTVSITVESLEPSTQFTAASYEIPVSVHEDAPNPRHREDFERLLREIARSSE